jgi:integral membrane sensor domain MASE1
MMAAAAQRFAVRNWPGAAQGTLLAGSRATFELGIAKLRCKVTVQVEYSITGGSMYC